MSGWIKVNREIADHWIYQDSWKFKCWFDLLLIANHTETKVNIKGKILTCKRGETLRSLDTLSKRWDAEKSGVRRFLKLLEKDNMIVMKSEQVTTRLTICNYDSYQLDGNASETKVKRKRNASETHLTPNKNEKNEKNEIILGSEIDFSPFDSSFDVHWQTWLGYKKSQFGFRYKELSSEQTAFNDLVKKANGERLQAIAIINNSIANGWKGMFINKDFYPEIGGVNKQTIARPIGTTKSMFE